MPVTKPQANVYDMYVYICVRIYVYLYMYECLRRMSAGARFASNCQILTEVCLNQTAVTAKIQSTSLQTMML